MAPHCYHGHEASPWHGRSQFLTPMHCWVAHRSDCQRSMLSCKEGSSKQDCKVWRALCLSHLYASDSWNRQHLEPVRHRADPRNIVHRRMRITAVKENTRETVFLFQRLSIALQRGNAVAFLATFDARRGRCFCLV